VKIPHSVRHWIKFMAIALLTLAVACQGYAKSPVGSTTQPASPLVSLTSQPTVSVSTRSTPVAANTQAASAQLVDIRSLHTGIRLDLRYATANNFLHRPLYKESRCLLRAIAAQQLSQVQADLETIGLGLKVYDCYRPLSVQKEMWKLFPNALYVANPAYGSRHNRGAAVDLTLVDRAGNELTMPTAFDAFTEQAASDYEGASPQATQNRQRLQDAMTKRDFQTLESEWWHFDAAGWAQFPVMDIPLEASL